MKPTECEHCHAALDGEDPEPMRHQITELPEIKPIVTEKRYHKLKCINLDETRLPQENANGWLWVAAAEKVLV